MFLTSSDVAEWLGVSTRQAQRICSTGVLEERKFGSRYAYSAREVEAIMRTQSRGRNWSTSTRAAALDLLSTGNTQILSGSPRSRLRNRLRNSPPGAISRQILRSRVRLHSPATPAKPGFFQPTLLETWGLSGLGGTGVVLVESPEHSVRATGLIPDPEGRVVVVTGDAQHREIYEALSLYTFGDYREMIAATEWLSTRQSTL
jgi:hypothetical protein